ncbi:MULTISPECIES: hypothetical protein [Gammaproteobacteria]|uniref:hypothetical protein n=1 Tax=Gammaproteobacteria TaxID=1236 RepID=UPI0011470E06|nr:MULTISPECIES: hypothetical protein [Gammaproteobacteria]WNO60581.1 hypothetical protein RDV63_06330 [Rheinheimera sp. MMS21-TC3]
MNWLDVRSFVFVAISALSLTGCGSQEYVDACHLKVQQQATHTAEIVSTEVERQGLDYKRVYGKAKLQNGFGAWTNYTYRCSFTGITVTDFKLKEGW